MKDFSELSTVISEIYELGWIGKWKYRVEPVSRYTS